MWRGNRSDKYRLGQARVEGAEAHTHMKGKSLRSGGFLEMGRRFRIVHSKSEESLVRIMAKRTNEENLSTTSSQTAEQAWLQGPHGNPEWSQSASKTAGKRTASTDGERRKVKLHAKR